MKVTSNPEMNAVIWESESEGDHFLDMGEHKVLQFLVTLWQLYSLNEC